ncbi:hypothetical protein BDN70DRAFT_884778 [Pholiota conissans]|uniref:Uncharacterized protein n=1 Tax=Pholiota conissans TaxID=109636 RepID=A0A9P5YV80_9AGAR|nr:hypothetical protein BDN70DRAFT_884778 [Pholiota conissans]
MAPLPSRKVLESMKRIDIQRICKDYGVRANLKTEALIDLLLDTQSAPPSQPMRRSVSTRQPSKAGPSRVSSMVVHDIDAADEEEDQDENNTHPDDTKEEAPPTPVPSMVPALRTRKAKELQTHLGVGKPQIAGGHGPRAITRSSGSFKSRALKASRSIKPTEATIEEEPEPPSIPAPVINAEAYRPETRLPSNFPGTLPSDGSSASSANIRKMVEDAMRPLEEQIRLLKLEMTQIHAIKSEVATLRTEISEVRKIQDVAKGEFTNMRDLSTAVATLREDLKQLRDGSQENQTPPQPSTPKAQFIQPHDPPLGFGMPSAFTVLGPAPSPTRSKSGIKTKTTTLIPPHPREPESILGKRHRESSASNITGIVEEEQDDGSLGNELTKRVMRPSKKKARIERNEDESVQGRSSRQASSYTPDDELKEGEASDANSMHAFTVYRGTDEAMDYVDPPPPTNHLPDFFRSDSPPPLPPATHIHIPRPRSRAGVPTSSANAAENQPQTQAFNFGYLPMSSTPQDAIYMPSFPYPEPRSPTPSGSGLAPFMGRQDDRLDPFRSFGFPSPIRPTRNYGALIQDDRGVNPAALTQGSSSKQREPSATTDTRVPLSSDSAPLGGEPPLTSKRTMYGTELEGDTRFGDFGLEGMATSYWASGKF